MKQVLSENFVEALLAMQAGDTLSTDKVEGYIEKNSDDYWLKYPDSIAESKLILHETDVIILNPKDSEGIEEIVSWCADYQKNDNFQVVDLRGKEWMIVNKRYPKKFFSCDFSSCIETFLYFNRMEIDA